MSIPEPSTVASNLYNISDIRDQMRRRKEDDLTKIYATILDEVDLLVDAMNAYTESFRRLGGEFQDFRTDWTPEQRQSVAAKYREWIDSRTISEDIFEHFRALREISQAEGLDETTRESLKVIISYAEYFLDSTVEKLLHLKDFAEFERARAQMIDALATATTPEQAELIANWAEGIKDILKLNKEYLASANYERGRLRVNLTVLTPLAALPATSAAPRHKRRLIPSFLRRTPNES